MNIPINKILPNPEQPRKHFDAQELQGLSESIHENGVLLPVLVEQAGERYILHDGERRVRAAQMAGLTEICATVVPPLNGTAKPDRLVRALVANIQRADLGPIEEARSFKELVDQGLSVQRIAQRLGISGARVTGRLKLLELDSPIQELIAGERLPKDTRLVDALLELPAGEVRISTAKALANRKASIKSGVEACGRVAQTLRGRTFPFDEIPAVHMAVKKKSQVNRPVWDALAQVGKVPPWLLVEIGARNVCDRCGLREMASETTCKGCAMVELLQEMIGKV